MLWDKRYGGSEQDNSYATIPAKEGGYIAVGSSRSGVSGDKSEPNQSADPESEGEYPDFWIVRFVDETNMGAEPSTAQPVAATAERDWSFMTAWHLTSGILELSPSWYRGRYIFYHTVPLYNEWIARFVYDQDTAETRVLIWYYDQIYVQ